MGTLRNGPLAVLVPVLVRVLVAVPGEVFAGVLAEVLQSSLQRLDALSQEGPDAYV